jgi:ATP-dependent protease ClpP protease subunit
MNRYHPYKAKRNNRLSLKFKKDTQPNDDEETSVLNGEESPIDKLNPFNKLTKLNSFFNFNHDDDVYLEENHLYFKTDVNSDSVNKMCSLIRKYGRSIKELQMHSKVATIDPKPLYLHLSTYGGDLYQGFLGYDYIKGSKIPIYTVVEGFNASAGTIMSMGGKRRYMTSSSVMLIHQLRTVVGGKFNEIEEDYENCKEDMERIKNLYFKECRGKMTKKQISEELKHDRWWDADKCIKKGLCDEIYTDF